MKNFGHGLLIKKIRMATVIKKMVMIMASITFKAMIKKCVLIFMTKMIKRILMIENGVNSREKKR